MTPPLLELENLSVHYTTSDEDIRAVTDVSLTIEEQEQLGLVGESGCGKSTLAAALIGALDSNGEIVSGTIKYRGIEIQDYTETQLNEEIRWKEISYIPQASMSSLDPLQRLSEQAVELAKFHTDWTKKEALEQFREYFELVGLSPGRINDYPNQFSGGMQQRAIIALAMFLEPSLIIADEPTTALDVIMQDQVLASLDQLQSDFDIGLLLITHDIAVVFENCTSIAVMHGGQVVETGTIESVFDEPRHPYTILLQDAFTDIRYPDRELSVIKGKPPQLTQEIDFCTFADRCPWAIDGCVEGAPPLTSFDGSDHRVACIRADEMEELATTFRGPGAEAVSHEEGR